MLEPTYQADVVVVGSGIAGLSAARRLTGAGVTTVVLEAAHAVGSRMAAEKIDGFRLDRIGQLLSTAYPELRPAAGLDGLVLRPFAPRGPAAQRRTAPPRGRAHQVREGARRSALPCSARPRGAQGRGRRPKGRPVAVPGGRCPRPAAGPVPRWAPPSTKARLGAAFTRLARHPGGTAAGPAGDDRRGGAGGPGPAGPYRRRLPPSAARRAVVRPGPHHVETGARISRCAPSRPGGCVCRRAARRRCRNCWRGGCRRARCAPASGPPPSRRRR
ncbi:hypothetical protein SHIRM173S_13266 [Streptomyces hirsutus]